MRDATVLDRLTDRELWVVTAQDGVSRGGLIATNVGRVSIVPELPRMIVAIGRRHHTWDLIERSGAFGLHLIAEDHLDWVVRFGLQTGRDVDKLDGLAVETGLTGSPLLSNAVGWLDCRVEARMGTGDRTVYLAEVVAAKAVGPRPVLTASRMIGLVSDEVRTRLIDDLKRDAAADAELIRAWRLAR